MSHCVLYRTNLKYDGRVCALVRTLALSFPNDVIYVYEYPTTPENYVFDSPKNIEIIKSSFFLDRFKKSTLIQMLKVIEYGIKSFIFLLKKRPKSIQVHHETVLLGVYLYKTIFRKVKIIYDDKELYHIRDKNIPRILYWLEFYLIKKSELVITCNYQRTKALKFIHRNKIKNTIAVDNYVFINNREESISSNLVEKLNSFKLNNKKIILHQGTINEIRGQKKLIEIADNINDDWLFLFIGVEDENYNDFILSVNPKNRKNIFNIGYVNYNQLNSFYEFIDACVLMYEPNSFNNNFCAPNRLYSAINAGRPLIVNYNNSTLSSFINKTETGVCYKDKDSLITFFQNYNECYLKAQTYVRNYEYNIFIPSLFNYYTSMI